MGVVPLIRPWSILAMPWKIAPWKSASPRSHHSLDDGTLRLHPHPPLPRGEGDFADACASHKCPPTPPYRQLVAGRIAEVEGAAGKLKIGFMMTPSAALTAASVASVFRIEHRQRRCGASAVSAWNPPSSPSLKAA